MERALASLLSTIYYPFRHKAGHRSKNYRNAYYHSTASTSTNTYFFQGNNNKMTNKGRPLSLQTVELKVRMCCEGCERVVKQALLKLRGVDSVEVELELQKVTVTGYVERNKVLKEVRRSGKKAEFWPNPDMPLYFTTAKNYFHDEESFRNSYNYWRHGYNGDKHGHVRVPQRGDDAVSNIFNDDDVNACAVM
ncbi:heavy metal-associated isoprenylated plant protein 30-like [Zingiber officinale]|uniref:heavy metal-associated isoprenylated plant protein 30-like n=1 Tax=Zingiber officinale TaxID=94328 RepID=UPI001C4C1F7F|nr:heavy metal-associated isoprenylated plant protein 30-like [Zingiber officinale]